MREKLIELLNNSFDEQYGKRGLLTAPHTLESDMPFTDWNDWRSDEDDSDSYEVTHWMPLPEAPKEN